jgi:hypothetical protein
MSSKVNANATVENTSTLGGLEDEDASSEILATLAVSEGPSQTNDMHCFHSPNKHANIIQFVLIDDGGSDSTTIGQPLAPTKPPKAARKSTVKPKEQKASKAMGKPVTAIKATKPNSGGLVVTGTSASDLSSLPEFACAAWSTKFLPTLYDCLGCSSNPFVINPNIVKAIQEVVDFTYPGSEYIVHANDKLVTMVCCARNHLCTLQLTELCIGKVSPS